MNKKSYKRNQNRLYKEIKRRIIAEQAMKFPVHIVTIHRDIETLAVRSLVPNYLVDHIEFVKIDMVNKLAEKLIAEGFVKFSNNKNKEPIADTTEIEAKIFVVKPWQEG